MLLVFLATVWCVGVDYDCIVWLANSLCLCLRWLKQPCVAGGLLATAHSNSVDKSLTVTMLHDQPCSSLLICSPLHTVDIFHLLLLTSCEVLCGTLLVLHLSCATVASSLS